MEELKAANEEVTSINEELQSTNEELETSKEELQSYNEELHTINSELQNKILELETLSDNLDNLLNSTDIATFFWTPTCTSIGSRRAARTCLISCPPISVGRSGISP